KTKEFPLFSNSSCYTDDTVMTLAVAEILQKGYINDKNKIIDTFKKWGKAYPDAGYGGHFYYWVLGSDRKPYNSYGNGSAMRVSPCGWYGNSEEEVIDYAVKVTEVTHNHKEGIKGAVVTALSIYYARIGKSKEFLKEYMIKEYPEIKTLDYEELRKTYIHGKEICQVTMPQALYCFLISNSFLDCLRTTISIGGDSDTLAAISCAIAEAYYKDSINDYLLKEIKNRIPSPKGDCNPINILNNFISMI
ncbi:MAG: ADP-ribosylglycohydrolase family protein, partial [Acholeplasmatales bacterium]|nr:ADP-ribosylglycohydrolase family protein [Acholeplasmatales bacterium]